MDGTAQDASARRAMRAGEPVGGAHHLPSEWWERLLGRLAEWCRRHERGVARVLRLRVLIAWTALAGIVVLALVFSSIRTALVVPLSGLAMLVTMTVLVRSRTVAWTTVSLWYAMGLAWTVTISMITTGTSVWLAPRFDDRWFGVLGVLGVRGDGAGTAIAAFGEECLKLLPLAVLAAAAPGRVRRFSAGDWLLLGYASGLAFMVVEETFRSWVLQLLPGILDVLLGIEGPSFHWWPLSGYSFTLDGEVSAHYAGHHVLTALVAGCVGLGVWLWRRGGVLRMAGVLLPVAAWWIAVVDHFGFNATNAEQRWLGGEPSSAPWLLQASFEVTGHGWGRAWLLGGVLVAALLVDARTLRLAPPDRSDIHDIAEEPMGRAGPAHAVRDLSDRTRAELDAIVTAYRVRPGESRRDAAGRGRRTMLAVRVARAEAFTQRGEVAQAAARGVGAVIAGRRWVRLVAIVVAVVLALVGVVVAAWLAARIGPLIWDLTGGWLAGVFDRLGQWWSGLPWWGQVLVTAGITALVVVGTIATGGTLLAGIGLGLGVSGVATYGASHGQGVASLIRDPRGASARYLRTVTPGGLLLDTGEFLLTFVPGGALGSFAGATGGRLILRGADDVAPALDDVAPVLDDAAPLVDDVVRAGDDVANDLADALGPLDKVNNPDPAADLLAQRIGGESRVRFRDGPDNEFDVVSAEFVGQSKPANFTLGERFRDQAKTTFEVAVATGRTPYFHFEGPPRPGVLEALARYAERYGVEPVIDVMPLGSAG